MTKTYYSKQHEWLRFLDDGAALVGISVHAQEEMGELVFVELPDVGTEIEAGGGLAVVESVKAASEVYTPIAGSVVAVNEALSDQPDLVNREAEGAGWLVRLEPRSPGEVPDGLMSAADYAAFLLS